MQVTTKNKENLMKLLICSIVLLLISCERKIEISPDLITVENGIYLKEITYYDGNGNIRFIYIVVDQTGKPIQGTSTNYVAGKSHISTTSIILDSTEYLYYKKLQKKYEKAEQE